MTDSQSGGGEWVESVEAWRCPECPDVLRVFPAPDGAYPLALVGRLIDEHRAGHDKPECGHEQTAEVTTHGSAYREHMCVRCSARFRTSR